MIDTSIKRTALATLLAAALLGGCSSGAGFGSPPPIPNAPQPTTNPQGGGGANGQPNPDSSPTPNTPLSVDSATARLAYDGSASDPVKAAQLVEVTFALASTLASPMPVPNVAIAADKNPAVNIPLSLQAVPNQDTVETLVAVAPPKDASDTKSLSLIFGDGKKSILAEDTIDFPSSTDDSTMTPLDKKQPPGGVTLDDVAISTIIAPGGGLHFDLTFSITNSSKKDANIAYFTVTPPLETVPKGQTAVPYPVKIVIPTVVPARNQMAPISIVIPYLGKAKTLPTGSYALTASDKSGNSISQAAGPLL